MLISDNKPDRQFATRIKLLADKIAFFYMNSDKADENTTRALKDMIQACQSELDKSELDKSELNKSELKNNKASSLLQSRKEDIIARIMGE